MIIIDIAPIMVLFCNCPLADMWLLAVKRYRSQYKVFVALAWLNSNQMFGPSTFWDKSPTWFLKKLELFLFYLRVISKFLKMQSGNCPNCTPKHVKTSTNLTDFLKSSSPDPGKREKPNLDFSSHFFVVPQKVLWRS